jgi:hypothetical protein
MEIKKRHNLKNWNLKQKDNFTTILVFICKISCIFFFMWSLRFFYTRVFKTGRIMVYRRSVRPFHMLRSNLRTPWPIYFKFHRVIGIDGLTVYILYGEISNFHSRVMGLYSSNCRWFFVCCTVNWEPKSATCETDGWTVGHWYTIICPVLKTGV